MQGLLLGGRLEDGRQELHQLLRLHPIHGCGGIDEALLHHLHGAAHRGEARPLPASRLEDVELSLLHGELDVQHVLVMGLQPREDLLQLAVDLGHRLFQGRQLRRAGAPAQGPGRPDAGHHVLALGVGQVLAVVPSLAGGRIPGEGHPGGGGLAAVSEDHGLDVDRGAPVVWNPVQLAVRDGPVVVPGAEDGPHGAQELLLGIQGKVHASRFLDDGQIAPGEILQVLRREKGVLGHSAPLPGLLEGLLKQALFHAEHHVGVHLDQAAETVPGEAAVLGEGSQSRRGLEGESQVQDGVHHARHGGAGARPDRHEKGVSGIAEAPESQLLQAGERRLDLREQSRGEPVSFLEIAQAGVGGDGEARRNRDSEAAHLRQVRPLPSQQVPHPRMPVRLSLSEEVDPVIAFCFSHA